MAAVDASTEPFTLGPPEGATDTAVLLLHGFTGSPWELRLLGESLAARGFHVRAPRLPGHESPEAMQWCTWHDWEAAAVTALDELRAFRRAVVAGLSMGGLLGLLLAARAPRRLAGLALMAPVVGFRRLDARALRLVRHLPLTGLRGRWLHKHSSDIEDDAMRAEAPLLPRYPLGRLFDLFALQDVAAAVLPMVHVPTFIAAAVHDHVVPFDAVERLHRALPSSRFLALQRGFHLLPRDLDRALLFSEVAEFVDACPGL